MHFNLEVQPSATTLSYNELTSPSHAYLDPGTSGALLATILGIMAAGWTYIKNKFIQIVQLIKKKIVKIKTRLYSSTLQQ